MVMARKLLIIIAAVGGIVYFFRKNKYSSTRMRMHELSGEYEV